MAAKIINADGLAKVLSDRGLVPPNCRRIVIDAEAQEPVKIYYETYADERLIEVFQDPSIQLRVADESLPATRPE